MISNRYPSRNPNSYFKFVCATVDLVAKTSSLFSVRAIDDMCRDKVDDDVIRNVERIIELVMIRDNMLQLSSNVFSLMDIRDIISFLCTN